MCAIGYLQSDRKTGNGKRKTTLGKVAAVFRFPFPVSRPYNHRFRMKPTTQNTELASLERYLEAPHRFGAYRIALGFPNSYEIGMSNLGFQWVYRLFNRIPDLVCERFFYEEGGAAVSFESGTPLSGFGLLASSLSWA